MLNAFRIVVGFLVFLCSNTHAYEESDADTTVRNLLQEVDQLFKQRSLTNPQLIDTILQKLSRAEDQADDSDLNYDVYIFESKALYWKAKYLLLALDQLHLDHLSDAGKQCLTLGKAKADAAIQVNNGYADGYYFSALNLAALVPYIEFSAPPNSVGNADSAALTKAWQAADDATKMMHAAIERLTRSNQNGEEMDGWGPYRELALIQANKPYQRWNWDLSTAIWNIKTAYDNARNYASNVLGYANGLVHQGKYERLLAGMILDLMLSKDPTTYNSERIQETLLEFEKAKAFRKDIDDNFYYQSAKEGLQDYATATKLCENVSIRIASSETKLNDLNGEHLSWLETQKQQAKIFSTFDLLRSKIEDSAPALIVKIQAYLASQQDTIQTVLDDLNRQLKETKDSKTRDSCQFDIIVLSDLAAAKRSLGESQEDLKKVINTAVNGTGNERAKALSYFDPLTQICLKWVCEVTPPTRENIFLELKQETTNLEAFTKEHLSTLESQIRIAQQNLIYAQDDEFIAHSMATKIYNACQKASNRQ